MPKDTEEVPPPAFPHLPEELWLHIASLLSTEEWARASSLGPVVTWGPNGDTCSWKGDDVFDQQGPNGDTCSWKGDDVFDQQGPNGDTCSWKGDDVFEFSEPTEFGKVLFGENRVCKQHNIYGVYDRDIFDDFSNMNNNSFMYNGGYWTDYSDHNHYGY
ncbi:g1596 [Coccomyxa elongata]